MDGNDTNGGKFATPANSSVCCLIENSKKCSRPTGSHSYSKRMQKTVKQKRLKFSVDSKADHTLICHFHRQFLITEGKKGTNANSSGAVSKKSIAVTNHRPKLECESDDEESTGGHQLMKKRPLDKITVNFEHLSTNALKRYKKFFKLQLRPNLNKSQLAEIVSEHFGSIPVSNEKEIMTYFIYAVKTKKNKLDNVFASKHSPLVGDE